MARFLSAYKHLVLVMEPAQFGEYKGRRIEFVDGEYVTDDPEEIEFIRSNSGYGLYITEVEQEKDKRAGRRASDRGAEAQGHQD